MATAPPTDELENAVLFAQQVEALLRQYLSEEGRYVFSHFTQAHGFLLMSIAISRHHGCDRNEFLSFMRTCWKESEDRLSIDVEEPKP